MKLYIQNNVTFYQNGILLSNDTHTIIWIDIYKNQLNTDVLDVKHLLSIDHNDLGFFLHLLQIVQLQ